MPETSARGTPTFAAHWQQGVASMCHAGIVVVAAAPDDLSTLHRLIVRHMRPFLASTSFRHPAWQRGMPYWGIATTVVVRY